jgi:hypothetical protein
VFLDFKPRDASSCSNSNETCGYSAEAKRKTPFETWVGFYPGIPTFSDYYFQTTVSSSIGVSSFTVRIQDGDKVIHATNNDVGFPFDDVILPQLSRSCLAFNTTTRTLSITVAVSDSTHLLPWFGDSKLMRYIDKRRR